MQALPFAAVALALAPALALSQEGGEPARTERTGTEIDEERELGETVVSARKWVEGLEEVPQSASVLSGAELERGGIRTVRDASLLVPNVHLTEFSARRLSFPFVRGIGSGQGEPGVTTYVDGVPQLATGSTNLPLIDLARVEFLRGPQGTLYGRNTIGGMIHLVTEPPGRDPRLGAFGGLGNYGLFEWGFTLSGPIVEEGAGLGMSLFHSQREGYSKNDFTGNDVDTRHGTFGRVQLHLQPSKDSELRLSVHGERARDGGFALSELQGLRERPRRINQDFEGVAERDVVAPSVVYERRGGTVDFTSITAYTDWDVLETADFDFSPIDGVRRRTEESQRFLYQELRLSSAEGAGAELGDGLGLRWLFGASGFFAETTRKEQNDFRPGGAGIFFPPGSEGIDSREGDFDDLAGALFGNLTLALHERFELGAGLRYDHESKDADLSRSFSSGGMTFPLDARSEEKSFDAVLPRFSAAWRADERTMVYGLAARGFKAGGFNLAAPDMEIAFDEETSWTYELGVKRSFADERLRASAAVFHIDWNDMQLSLFDPTIGGYVTNAGESTSRGFEVELAARVLDPLDLFGSFGLIDTEFDEFVDPFGEDVSGNSLAFAPKETWAVGAHYQRAFAPGMDWFLRTEYVGVGTFYYDAGNRESESYQLVNLRGGITRGDWRLELWVRNLFDDEYVPVAFQPNPADPTLFVGESGAPRTYGLALSASF